MYVPPPVRYSARWTIQVNVLRKYKYYISESIGSVLLVATRLKLLWKYTTYNIG